MLNNFGAHEYNEKNKILSAKTWFVIAQEL